jgi:hypothetical protein
MIRGNARRRGHMEKFLMTANRFDPSDMAYWCVIVANLF